MRPIGGKSPCFKEQRTEWVLAMGDVLYGIIHERALHRLVEGLIMPSLHAKIDRMHRLPYDPIEGAPEIDERNSPHANRMARPRRVAQKLFDVRPARRTNLVECWLRVRGTERRGEHRHSQQYAYHVDLAFSFSDRHDTFLVQTCQRPCYSVRTGRWRNGIRTALRTRRREAWEFESPPTHKIRRPRKCSVFSEKTKDHPWSTSIYLPKKFAGGLMFWMRLKSGPPPESACSWNVESIM